MANVGNIDLTIGKNSDGLEFAEVSYVIYFSEAEVNLGLDFEEIVLLLEQDQDLDVYLKGVGWPYKLFRYTDDGGTGNESHLDDFIGQIARNSLKATATKVARKHKKAWQFPANESGEEEYRALVYIKPEICESSRFSNVVKIDVRDPE